MSVSSIYLPSTKCLDTLPNKYYETDIKRTLEINRFFFRALGIWPYKESKYPYIETFTKISLILVCYFFLFCDLIPTILYVLLVEKDARIKVKLLGPAIYSILSIVKYSSLVFGSGLLKNCLAQLDDDWRNVSSASARNSMMCKAAMGKRILISCAVFMYFSGFYFRTIWPLSRPKIVTDQNVTIRHLPCPVYFIFFDVQKSPAYEFVFFIQFFTGLVKYTLTIAICSFTALVAMHICAHLEILVTLMNNLMNQREIKKVKETLALTVQYQIKTKDFSQLVQETLQYTNLMEILGSTLIICLTLYCFVMEWENQNIIATCSCFILFMSIVFNVFIFCFIGEQVSIEGEKLALTVSSLTWYHLPDTIVRSLILIIVMSNAPNKLKAGKLFELSLKTFGDVVKTSLTYFNFLRNFS